MHRSLYIPLVAAVLACQPLSASAQIRNSVFASYEDFTTFIDEKIKKRHFGALFQSFGGNNLSLTDIQKITTQAQKGFPVDFEEVSVMRRQELENGFVQEARAYWVGDFYAYVYVLLHQRGDELVVVNFTMNAQPGPVMALF